MLPYCYYKTQSLLPEIDIYSTTEVKQHECVCISQEDVSLLIMVVIHHHISMEYMCIIGSQIPFLRD